MKFLLDANIPYSTKEIFKEKHQVFHVRDLNLEQASDYEVITWAKKNKAVLITRDLDFANILNFPPAEYFGILVLRSPYFYSATENKKILKDFLTKIDFKTLIKSTIIIEEGRYRVRK